MATFNGGRMVALSFCLLFANASFAQDGWVTVAVYMPDPIVEEMAPEVEAYIEKWLDPLTWETFERDFTPAREAQLAQVEAENEARIRAAEAYLKADLTSRGNGTSTWYPAWIPLALAKGDKEEGVATDSLFKNILYIEGPKYSVAPRAGEPQTLREFFELDGYEPDGLKSDGTQDYRTCIDGRERCRKEELARFLDLIHLHDDPEVNIISFTVRARRSEEVFSPAPEDLTFAGEQDGGDPTKSVDGGTTTPSAAEFDYESIRLLQPAVHDPSEYVIDVSPYWIPAAKPSASAEGSSWGRIKATFAAD